MRSISQLLMHKARTFEPEAFGKVAVLMGGTSPERDVSIASGQNVLKALITLGIDARGFDPRDEDLFTLKQLGYDRAFNVLHGPVGEDGTVQAILDYIGVPYTGSGVTACAVAMDKVMTKRVWKGMGLPTPDFGVALTPADAEGIAHRLGYPLVLKPINQGSSIGVVKAAAASELFDAYAKAAVYGPVLIEQMIQGAELTVAVVHDEALKPLQIGAENDFFDYHAKYEVDTKIIEAPLSDEQRTRLQQLALDAHHSVGAKLWSRSDVMMDHEGNFWFLEINTVPGMTSHSLVPFAAKLDGVPFEILVVALLASTMENYVQQTTE